MHGDDHNVGARSQACDVGGHTLRFQHGDAVVLIGVVAVGLIVGIGEKTVACAIAFDHRAAVRLIGGVAGAGAAIPFFASQSTVKSTP